MLKVVTFAESNLTFLVAQTVNHLLTMQETLVRSLGRDSTCQERQSRDSGRQHELRGSSDLGSNLVFAFDQLCDLG